jgi:hypothetical protein
VDQVIAETQGVVSGKDFILSLEERLDSLLEQTVQRSSFWTAMRERPEDVPVAVFWGMCLENYHILAHEPLFDAPVLCFAGNHAVRQTLNRFYAEELGHDKLLLKALAAIGLEENQVRTSIPLSSTFALIDGLAYWSRYDPLFFVATLGVLEGREVAVDAFVEACKEKGLPRDFIAPIESHSRINAQGRHGELTREAFSSVPAVSQADQRRIEELLPLFVSIYDAFYEGIWTHYGAFVPTCAPGPDFLRRLPGASW